MSQKPWRQAQVAARSFPCKLDTEVADLRRRLEAKQLGAFDWAAKLAAAIRATESMIDLALDRNEPPLTAGMAQARVDHQACRVECHAAVHAIVVEGA